MPSSITCAVPPRARTSTAVNSGPSSRITTVTITVPGAVSGWRVDFYDTKTGTTILSSTSVTRKGDAITVPLPDFHDDIAFKLYPQ